MGQIHTISNIRLEDVPDKHRSWFGKIVTSLNRFMSSVVNVLNKNVTFQENMKAFIKTVTFDNTAAGIPFSFANELGVKPQAVIKQQIEDLTSNFSAGYTAVDVNWEYTAEGKIKIKAITGLTASNKYRITLLVY